MSHDDVIGSLWGRGINRSAVNSPQKPVTWSFDVFFDLRLNKRLSKQSWGWWFGTPSCPLWRHCNDLVSEQTLQLHKSLLHGLYGPRCLRTADASLILWWYMYDLCEALWDLIEIYGYHLRDRILPSTIIVVIIRELLWMLCSEQMMWFWKSRDILVCVPKLTWQNYISIA